ncbi:hypothetical protein PR003_g23872 [Phytophthora rubi]|uniref:WW domain-containing oxidoreductase n=1 Tax=Phytophthora rubi TaxID=129364 RepID=A0A6A3IEV1_9STRA|nr:hypothetical protein PR001_g24399 [Phytophthora rubi]KAE9295951.1 hypothetical protein PR003_g23872 [Phytophthora rubi]
MGNSSSNSVAVNSRPQVPDTWSASDIPSQSGKLVVITGANSGIGYQAALELARKGADVVLACRSEARGKQAEQRLRDALASSPGAGTVKFMLLDVSDLSSVKRFAQEFNATHHRLDLLINNAGVMAVPYAKTVDGYERQFATNHLGHFALTAQLFPLLKASAPSRVVNTSSIAHKDATLARFVSGGGVMHTDAKGYGSVRVYAESKLCNLLFTFELGRRVRDQKLIPLRQDVPMGTLPTLYAATGADVESGDYYGASRLWEIRGPPKRVEALAIAHDETTAKNLWDESERLANVKFDVQ